ncbi:SWIM zinc finger family protein [Sporosarcina sp. ITBMC105]
MNLYHFKEQVSPVILQRGFTYFASGLVTDITHDHEEGRYRASVEGTDLYEISIHMDEDYTILSSECTCPYDSGPICKHEVAVLYELLEHFEDGDFPEQFDSISNQPDLKDVLGSLSKEKLIAILVDLADEDSVLHNRLVFNYASVDAQQELHRCRELIDSVIHKYMAREGYISYKYVSDFATDLTAVLERIDTIKDPLIATEVAGLLLTEAVNSYQYADDSGGEIGYVVDQTITTIRRIAEETTDVTEQRELLERLIQLSKDNVFEGWVDYRNDLLSISTLFAEDDELRSRLIGELESCINHTTENHYKDYSNEQIYNLLFEMIQTHGTVAEAHKFLHDKLDYPSFRERLMHIEWENGNSSRVLELALTGEKKDANYRGLVTRWKKWRYKAYKEMNMSEEQIQTGRELLFAGEFDYYWDLKELAADDFPSFYDHLKKELATSNQRMFLQLIEAENDVDSMLRYVQANPSSIEQFLKYLMDAHKEEAIRLFGTYIKEMADQTYNRSQYRGICQMLRRFKKIGGHIEQIRLIEELKELYKRRPAFIDELSKL